MALTEQQKELLKEISTTIIYGCIPGVGQGIDAWQTIDAGIDLYKDSNSLDNRFNFVICLMGWLPIMGDGTKATLKTVNKNPDIYAPIMFDVMRYAFAEAADNKYVKKAATLMGWDINQIKYIDPEQVLIKYTSSSFINQQLNEAKQRITSFNAYKNLSVDNKQRFNYAFNFAQQNLPALIGVVGDRVTHWRKKVPKSSHNDGVIHSKTTSPNKTQETYIKNGKKTAQDGVSNPANSKGRVKTTTIKKMTKMVTGVVGEHMADYYMDKKHATGGIHDQGAKSNNKVSQNGLLKKLISSPTGFGIDGLWRDVDEINTLTGDKKGFCIVEAKASVSPAIKTLPQLLTVKRNDPTAPNGRLVQMSDQWCENNAFKISRAVGADVRKRGYSRRVFYYNQLSIKEHEYALGLQLAGKSGQEVERAHSHAASRNHHPTNIFTDSQIEAAVKQRQTPSNRVNKTINEADIPK